jgi:hypothetical protein
MEWVMMPLFAATHSLRSLSLLNVAAFALLPGAVFRCCVGLGLGGHAAWLWMWVLPSAYCFASQAGGTGNDLYGAVLVLISLGRALRHARNGNPGDAWVSLLASALATGVKASNLPFVLPSLVLLGLHAGAMVRRPAKTCAIAVLALVLSFGPHAAMNVLHTGVWHGDPHNTMHVQIIRPLAGLAGNLLMVLAGCIHPPVVPYASVWNSWVAPSSGHQLFEWIREGFPRFGLEVRELVNEEAAGLGPGVFLVFLGLLGTALTMGGIRWPVRSEARWLLGTTVLAGLVYMLSMGSESGSRLLAPWYGTCILGVMVLLPGLDAACRSARIRTLAACCVLSAVPIALFTPSRPLLPVPFLAGLVTSEHTGKGIAQRAQAVYGVYAHRADSLAALRQYIPEGARVVGFLGGSDDPDVSLWRPWGARKVVHLLPEDLQKPMRPELTVVVGRETLFTKAAGGRENRLLEKGIWTVVGRAGVVLKVQEGAQDWIVAVRAKRPDAGARVSTEPAFFNSAAP